MEKRVLLVVMPWSNPALPNLALGLLKSILERDGLPCDTLYGNVLASRFLDVDGVYDRLSAELASELIFTPLYFGTERAETAARLSRELAHSAVVPAGEPAFFLDLMERAEAFIAALLEEVEWEPYDIIGFSLTFQETMASLCLARALKARYPEKRILFGGAACDGEMGLEMLRAFAEVDYAVVGEADGTISSLVRAIRGHSGSGSPEMPVPGVAYRDGEGRVQFTGPAPVYTDLDALPHPSFDDYFEQLERSGAPGLRPRLYVETSRGCWYGEKQACSFCGLSSFLFRRKAPERALAEILALSSRYHTPDFYMSDNILDHRYFDTLLPRLAALRHQEGMDFTAFYEVKSNLRRSQVQAMAAAGIRMVQIGIESFNDHVLQLMAKGTTAIQQIQSLKYLAEYDIAAVWNIIYANPQEQPEDYLAMAEVLPYLHHLPPPMPGQVGPMVLQRFNQYWLDPERYGIRNVRPLPLYRAIFPDPGIDHARLACFFEYDLPELEAPDLVEARQTLFAAVDEWRRVYQPDLLTYQRGPGFVQITDRRPGRGQVITLRGLQDEIFSYCDSARTEEQILRTFRTRAATDGIRNFLQRMVQDRLMYRSEQGRYLSLPLHRRSRRS